MRLLLRSLLGLATVMVVLVLLSPWLLYEWGLQHVEILPVKSGQMASAEQRARVWQHARASTPQRVEPLNPYSYLWYESERAGRLPAAETLAAWVARDHIFVIQPQSRGPTRQLAEAALMIWLTRHWSTEELVSAAVPIVDRDLKYRARRAAEAAAEHQAPARSRAASSM